jgi:uncharacterized protein (TIGR02145 family)
MNPFLIAAFLIFIDPRDGKRYETVEIAGMTWFARNLDHAMPGSFCFNDDETQCARLGRLYDWDLAMRACPGGWHLSTEDEWRRLETHLGMPAAELEKTKGRGEGIGDKLKVGSSSGLDIPLAGWRKPDGTYVEGNYHDNHAAALWVGSVAGPGTAWHRDVAEGRSVIWRSPVDKPYALSVRCVKDR